MIGSFWNLCRACPSMPVDKLHSEYRSTYRWHEYTGNSRPEVVRKPPVPNQFGPINEPPLPRRKKCPELAYKTHEFIGVSEAPAGKDETVTRARSEERGIPSRRSKSEGPAGVVNGKNYDNVIDGGIGVTSKEAATLFELEPLVDNVDSGRSNLKQQAAIIDKKATVMEHERPISQLITKKENFGFSEDTSDHTKMMNGIAPNNEEWYKEVIELRKKAVEYKCRGWGIEIDPDMYKKQKDLWDQVSKRSSLSALSLASSIHRPITKEEKDEENNKKFFQGKPASKIKVPGQAIDNKTLQEGRAFPQRVHTIRHHLERTTGPDVEEGALLPSPTREKLTPAIPKSKDTDSYSSQRGSPKKSETSRHCSPQKGSPQKGSPKKIVKGRSQSVGPSVVENESPKRKMRSVSTAPATAKSAKADVTTTAAPSTEKKPRPSDGETQEKETAVSISSCSPQPGAAILAEITEHVVKSPPEPTRVKSPEQILMRSPDPVNWTVPLDTGKTFTVTQNVKDGELYNRPQSEVKSSTPVERPPPAPQSAPPELTEQTKMEAWQSNAPFGGYDDIENPCLQVPEIHHSLASDVFEMARNRFDSFWGANKNINY